LKALIEDFACADTTDAQLATAARRGSQPAFEALFRRYRPRITAFVRGSVPDDGRVDDVVQEVFVSALRNLGTLETPDAFAPWLHRIARNACIDHLRRVSREEIAIDSYQLDAAESRPLRPPAQSIHGHVSSKEDIEHLRQAFGELPAAQHKALVLRELEGLSYDEIGRRLSLSRPAVESILFRARRGLKGEFAEISTGARCLQVRSAMAGWAEGIGAGRERRVAMRHLRTCQGCRREAAAMGLHGLAHQAAQAGSLRRVVDRAAALIPLPVFLFRRDPAASGEAGAGAGAGASGFSTQAQTALVQMSAAGHAGADQAASLAQKAVAVVATVAVVGGGGMAVKHSGIPVSLPKVVSSHGTKQDSAAVRPNGLPTDPRKAAEVLYGGQGPLPAGAKRPALVVPALVVNALPQAPVGGDVTGPPSQPPGTALGGSSPAADAGGTVPGSSSDGSPAAGVPDVSVPVTTPVTAAPVDTPATNGNGNGNPNGNGKAKGHDKNAADPVPVSAPPVTNPVANPVPPPVDVPAPPVLDSTGAPVDPAILQSMEAGNSGKIPPGQLKKITGTKKA
jgi:RNA polymerase sigma factor (sigma-70 family)